MYVSRAVREIRDDPIPGESVTLLLRLADDADPAAVAETVRDHDTARSRRNSGWGTSR